MFKKIGSAIKAHKVMSIIIAIAIVGGGYYWYRSAQGTSAPTKYVVGQASLGTVVASVSGSGQVQALSSIPVKNQGSGSGAVTGIYVKVGQHVTAGQLLVQVDTTNEEKALKQAELTMQSANLSLAKLQEAPATTTLQQDEDAVAQASTSLATDYQSAYDSLGGIFVDFQTTMTGLQNFMTGKDVNKTQNDPDAFVSLLPTYQQEQTIPFRDKVTATFSAATEAYAQDLADYHALSRNSSSSSLDALFTETENAAKSISDAVSASRSLINQVVNSYPISSTTQPLPAIVTADQNAFSGYTGTISGDITSITNSQNGIANDEIALKEKQTSLASLQAGADPLDVQSQQISIQNAQLSLQTAQDNLADDSIRAPVSGTVSAIAAVVGTPIASSAVTLAADGEVAQVTLNEVDAAKVSLGDQTTLTFDALPDLSIAGQVVEIDPVGTVTQGVVNYSVQISFTNTSTSTSAIKPGMSVTANIVTDAHQNVVTVPNAAVVTQNGSSYVLAPATPVEATTTGGIVLPQGTTLIPVTVGISNNTITEITSGLKAGDQIITQTIRSSSGSTTSGGTNALRALGGGGGGAVFGGGGGAVRIGAPTGR
ncbi:MAG TPA: HlyD family efflux transporter periplasmic adaptor subunit [Candidatus Paceibacterota bacterium]|nr:HlyD family efflux transporter periplasmic adaptor subunit [Candidatus Paceibacterota bacterium]